MLYFLSSWAIAEPIVIVTVCDCQCIDDAVDDAAADGDIGGATALMLYYIENCVPTKS